MTNRSLPVGGAPWRSPGVLGVATTSASVATALAPAAAATDALGRLAVPANNAGYGDVGSIEDMSLANFRADRDESLWRHQLTKAAIPLMREQKSDDIMQFSSLG